MSDLLSIELSLGEDGYYYFRRDGLNFRFVPGEKATQYVSDGGPDWALQWETPDYGWQFISYSTLGVLVTALGDNEERIAPQGHPDRPTLKGRKMLADAFYQAVMKGAHTVRWSR